MTEPSPGLSLDRRPTGRTIGLALLLAIAVLAAYWPAFRCGFVDYDDPEYVSANPHVLRGLTVPGVIWAFTTGHASNWHPLTWLSLMLDAQLLGPTATGFHVVNVLLHTANTVVLFLLLRALTGACWRSALVAAWFGLHPLHVESVAWISERKDVLSALFGLLTLWMYGLSVKTADGDPCSRRFHKLAVLFFVLGLLSKPMLVTLPFVMVLMDYWPLRRFDPPPAPGSLSGLRQSLRGKLPFLVLAALSAVITCLVQSRAGSVQSLETFPPGQRLANAFVAIAIYLKNTFWPDPLTCLYLHQGAWPVSWVIGSVLLTIGLSVFAFWVSRRSRLVFTGWFWFLGMLVPVIGLVQVGVQSLADRYTYLPLIGLLLVFSWGAAGLAVRNRVVRVLVVLAVTATLVVCGLRTRDQLRHWHDSESLFRHACAVTPNNHIALNNLGLCLFNQGRVTEAIDCYQQAVQANPAHAKSYNNLGNAYAQRGDSPAALRWFEEALRVNPRLPEARYNYGNLLLKLRRLPEAIDQYQQARVLEPRNATTCNNLGLAFALAGRTGEAVASYREALAIDPDYTEALVNLGGALLLRKEYAAAAASYEAALRREPGEMEFHYLLANALALGGKNTEALGHYQLVLQNQPQHPGLHLNYAGALAAAGRWTEAANQYRAALDLDPDNPRIHFRLGIVLMQLGERTGARGELNEALRLQPDHPEATQILRELGEPTQP